MNDILETPESVTLAVPSTATAPAGARTITGLVAPFGQIATNTSFGKPLRLKPGSLVAPDDLSRVKLCMDHDRTNPVGFMTSMSQTDVGVTATFHVPEGPSGDAALAAARDHLKDGLSVGMNITRGKMSADQQAFDVDQAVLYEVSLCAVPAYEDARVTDVHLHRTERTTTMDEQNTTGETTVEATQQATSQSVETSAQPPTQASQPSVPPQDMRPGATTRPRPVSLQAVFNQVAQMVATGMDANQVTAALTDILPADDAGQGFLTEEQIGQVWQPVKMNRWWIEQASTTKTLTNMFGRAWGWEVRPGVGPYAGNKTEIPSKPARTKPFTYSGARKAGGNDIDRVFIDFGEADMIEETFTNYATDLANQLNAEAFQLHLDNATPLALAGATVPQAVTRLAKEALAIGSKIDYIACAADLFDSFLNVSKDDLPWWVSSSLSLSGLSTDGNIPVQFDANLPAGTVLGGDKRACTFRESPVIRVQLVNLPQGGMDLAVFSYWAAYCTAPEAVFTIDTTGEPTQEFTTSISSGK